MRESPPKREVIGLVFRGMRAELDRRGLTQRVLARLEGEAREALEHPPPHSAWLPGDVHDAIAMAIAQETDRETLRDVGYQIARNTTGPIARPLIRIFLTLFGFTPVSLLNNLNRISALQVRGITFRYEPETERSGWLTVTNLTASDPVVFAVWEGVLTFGKDIFNMPVTVGTAVPDPDGRSAKLRVAW